MSTELKAPSFPESIEDGQVATWHKQVGDSFELDEVLVEIETDKVILEVVAPDNGIIESIVKEEGETVLSEEVIAVLSFSDQINAQPANQETATTEALSSADLLSNCSPSIRKMITKHDIDPAKLSGTGKNGRLLKEDVQKAIDANQNRPLPSKNKTAEVATNKSLSDALPVSHRMERREPMSRLRAKIASRLVEAQQSMAMLTTFNEVNMKPIMEMRSKYKDEFEKKHGTRLGFMSFFIKATVEALKEFPAVNASIDGNDIIYHSYQDIGVAVSSPRGLVVPVLRDVDDMGLAKIESEIRAYGEKAKNGKLSIDDLTGGTFTVSNGGVFGSLMSTPIVNPPQTAILGMHKIQDRPMAVDGQVVILPMMYLAVSYDHRLIDGKEAVGFLVHIKNLLEEPERLILGL